MQMTALDNPNIEHPRSDVRCFFFRYHPYTMLDKSFTKWWLGRVQPFRDVPAEKLSAEREAMERQQDFNRNYAEFLNNAVFPADRYAGAAPEQARHRSSRLHLGKPAFTAGASRLAVGGAGDHAEP